MYHTATPHGASLMVGNLIPPLPPGHIILIILVSKIFKMIIIIKIMITITIVISTLNNSDALEQFFVRL